MARDITITFDDGSNHVYKGVPDGASPDMVQSRAEGEFKKSVKSLDGGRSDSAVSSAPTSAPIKMGREGFEDTVRQEMQNMPWGERNKYGLSLSISRAMQGMKGLVEGSEINQALRKLGLPNVGPVNEDVVQASKVASQEAPVGAFIGDLTKYAPAMAAGPAIIPGMAAAATLGAAYEPGTPGERIQAGAIEGAASGVGGAAIKGVSKLYGMGAANRANDAVTKIIGPQNLDEAKRLITSAKGTNVTTEQALASLDDANIARLGEIAKAEVRHAKDPIAAAAERQMIEDSQAAARDATMSSMAKGSTAENAAIARKAFMDAQEAALGPVRVAELSKAGVGRTIPELEQQAAKLEYEAMVHGGTSAKAHELRNLADQISGAGYSPLNVGGIKNRIAEILGDPKLGSSVNVEDVISSIGGRISELVKRGGGVIDPDALYMVRKEGVNEAIDKLLAGRNPAMTRKLSAKLSSELKPLIDDAIENSGGTGWKSYIGKYGAAFEERGKLELADKLRALQKDNPSEFLKVMRGDNPDLVAKYGDWDSIKQALGDRRFSKASGVAGEVARTQRNAELLTSKPAESAVNEILRSKEFTRHIPNFLNRYVMVANAAMKEGEMKVNRGMFREIEQAMRSPEAMEKLLNRLPVEQRKTMDAVIYNLAKGIKPSAVAGASTMNTANKQEQ
jgi:hypothetical protein